MSTAPSRKLFLRFFARARQSGPSIGLVSLGAQDRLVFTIYTLQHSIPPLAVPFDVAAAIVLIPTVARFAEFLPDNLASISGLLKANRLDAYVS